MAITIISINDVSKSFDKQLVLKDVNLKISEGRIIGLIGPSGAGKSTVIKIILGMEVPDSGTTMIFDKKMPNRKLLGKIGYMAQTDALYEQLTGRENLKFYADMKGLTKQDAVKQIKHVAQVVDLVADLDKRAGGYSGGMKRRLSLAIALLGFNQVLILDEPTVGVDPALRKQIWSELEKLKEEGKTILVTTHVMDEAELTDEVALLLGGEIIADDTPTKLKQTYQVDSIEEVFLKAEAQQK
ncbi:ABC-type multidrug transport system, ATPase component [Companilactobacillus paralimentarius DSM 13238 = JCM 10415]|jgi:ABC-type multidrug transport system, ATPase component|uniref:ABC-type multidrug transport system, ATPase component n=1 Tax=Companilactobacillus paralimentarius DSM 13238 = JCM 10415 TaxID=1122151 RepID=A0A0R1PIL5_9LACO|nr:ABC transporter ATP-binding protein [Companilactobacillus paralimentarius]KAE9562606.1 glycosyl transferase family 2 [Companilactobacillus paralimentarius]KRL32097.1 ABC-type multidrug transport system, ATPase component [Companilactobacillus paralimentarius DSM 13238 = JCM 10415]MDR4933951.1 ABC transporter ATP-binding protein [Companilactobacillus paralimentarius]QFR70363.1 ATP-binding cassette domain-containing protein [Companilactobacillus paralimentarius]